MHLTTTGFSEHSNGLPPDFSSARRFFVTFLIDIEGIDGSGKGTQAALLKNNLIHLGLSVELVSFPRYGKTCFSQGIADFLNGQFGTLEQVDPFLVSLLYAGDRFESLAWFQNLTSSNEIIVLDRYVPSNMAHQGSKRTGSERDRILKWIDKIEYEVYALPRPDLILWLDLPVQFASERISSKHPRQYTAAVADLQESDLEHLIRTREVYENLSNQQPNWVIIPTVEEGVALTIPEINRRMMSVVLSKIETLLPKSPNPP